VNRFAARLGRKCRGSPRLLAAASAAAVGAGLAAGVPLGAFAQAVNPFAEASEPAAAGQMLLEADELIYDFDGETVTAVGGVRIYYGTAVLDAERVTYDQRAGRLFASGGVRLVEPDGNIITAETLDLTDDFRNGFVESLNVVTVDRARFSAQSAERRDGNLTVFHRGVYTACVQCQDDPKRPPLWQIKASRIIHDQSERTVYYRDARLEFFGVPIAYVPVFFHPDPTVRRKTGFLTPGFLGTEAIGYGVTTPFFINLAPNYDVTFSPTYLSRQGALLQAEWRHRLADGAYSVRFSGIRQLDPDAFRAGGEALSGDREFRGSFRTRGEFAINPDWSYGWDVHATTDRTFNRDYRIPGARAKDLISTAYLTGLSERNAFDLRGYHFLVQREDTVEQIPGPDYVHDDQAEQAIVHPVLDHNYVLDRPVFGGEVRIDSNLTSLSREESDLRHPPARFGNYYAGVAGTYTRASTRALWRRRVVGPAGQLITPFSYLQADVNWLAPEDDTAGLDSEQALGRAMPAGGVEYQWPFLATLGSSIHTFGPRAQLIVRPDEQHEGEMPNEDSQSLLFEDTNLFILDKFAGYDRQEGGTRANLGFEYTGLLPNGASVDALIGQSFQLAGENSFAAEEDHALTGIGSGLESDASDYLARVTVNTGTNVAVTARARFDDDDLALNRGEVNGVGVYGETIASVGYAYIRESPASGIFEDRQEVSGAASVAISQDWNVLASLVYDIENASEVSRSFGLAYADECFEVSAVYSETPDRYSDLVTDRTIFFRVNLRTLGDSSIRSTLDAADARDQ
jgi:LPS-assembly protein